MSGVSMVKDGPAGLELVLGLGLQLGLGLWFGLGGNTREEKCPAEMSDTPQINHVADFSFLSPCLTLSFHLLPPMSTSIPCRQIHLLDPERMHAPPQDLDGSLGQDAFLCAFSVKNVRACFSLADFDD